MAVARRSYVCPSCGKTWQIPADAADPERCPNCQKSFKVAYQELPPAVPEFRSPLPSRSRWPLLVAAVVVLAGVGLLFGMKPGKVAENILPRAVVDREFALVDAYLKEHLDNGDYEVVRWWPAMDDDRRKKAVIDDLKVSQRPLRMKLEAWEEEISHPRLVKTVQQRRDLQDQISRAKSDLAISEITVQPWVERLGEKVCRIKYRALNSFGAKVLIDQGFTIRDGTVAPIDLENGDGHRYYYGNITWPDPK